MLKTDPKLKRLYSAEASNNLEVLQGLGNIDKQLEKLRMYQQNCSENYPKSGKKSKTQMED